MKLYRLTEELIRLENLLGPYVDVRVCRGNSYIDTEIAEVKVVGETVVICEPRQRDQQP